MRCGRSARCALRAVLSPLSLRKRPLDIPKGGAFRAKRGKKAERATVGADPVSARTTAANNEYPAWSLTHCRGRPLCLPEQQRVAAREIFQKSIPKSFKIIHVQFMEIHVYKYLWSKNNLLNFESDFFIISRGAIKPCIIAAPYQGALNLAKRFPRSSAAYICTCTQQLPLGEGLPMYVYATFGFCFNMSKITFA